MIHFNPNPSAPGTEYYDIPIEDPVLNECGFTKFSLPLNGNALRMIIYNNKDPSMITYPEFDRHDLDKSVKLLQDKLVEEQQIEDKAGKDTVIGLVAYFRNACVLLAEDLDSEFFKNGNGKSKSKSKKQRQHQVKEEGNEDAKEKKEKKSKNDYTAYKYSNRGKGFLHEAVILAGRPAFLKCEDGKIQPVDIIEENIRIIRPPHMEHYAYEPYEFENINQVLDYVERARNESIDSLYLQAKKIAYNYNDQKQDKLSLLAIEIISSYFQDRFPTTHYDIVLGGNGSGKSTYGDTFTAVGYRVVNLTDPNAANINRILGSIEIGQCTIVSDETGAIDKHPDLLSILKTGYSARGKTSKINDNTRDPEFFFTYCFKMIISERMPNLRDARGVLDRSFTFTTYKGLPKYDIKETLEPQENVARQERLNALNDFRKLMLIYRLLHYQDPIPDVNIGVEGREKELSKPIIQLFYNTKAQREVETTLQNFLNLRTEKKEITLEPVLHPVVANLVSENGTEVSVAMIWEALKNAIDGHYDEKKPNEYQTLEYGTIYNNTISNILEHTFGGRPKHRRQGNTFIFDPEELARVGKAYNITTKIQTKMLVTKEENQISIGEGCEGCEAIREEPITPNQDQKSSIEDNLRGSIDNNNDQKEEYNDGKLPVEPSLLSQPSLEVADESSHIKSDIETNTDVDSDDKIIMPDSIHRLGHSDKWACKDCNLRDDKWGMIKHYCRGRQLKQNKDRR